MPATMPSAARAPAATAAAGSRIQPHAAAKPRAPLPWARIAARLPPSNAALRLRPPERTAGLVAASRGRAAVGGRALTVRLHASDERGEVKQALRGTLEGIDRGIFGIKKEQKEAVWEQVERLESLNPTPEPMNNLDKVEGDWRLIYTTVKILGTKRTKLGLRNFVNLGEFTQRIELDTGKAINEVEFYVPPLYNGKLTITASFQVASPQRVDITYENSTLVPEQLQSLFEKNFDILLAIFNPEGWLELTYVDEEMRVGRDDKGNIFVLEKVAA